MTSEEHAGPRLEPVRMAHLLRQMPGKWVALHNGEIIEARDTFDQVVMALKERDIVGATVIRAPDLNELVGLG